MIKNENGVFLSGYENAEARCGKWWAIIKYGQDDKGMWIKATAVDGRTRGYSYPLSEESYQYDTKKDCIEAAWLEIRRFLEKKGGADSEEIRELGQKLKVTKEVTQPDLF